MLQTIQKIFLEDIPDHRVSQRGSNILRRYFSLGELKNAKDITFRSLAGVEEVNLGYFLVDIEATSNE